MSGSVKLQALVLSGALALVIVTPALAGGPEAAPRPTAAAATAATRSAGSKGKPIGITVPVGSQRLRLEYNGPVAPWKVLNPFHKGERQSAVRLMGPKGEGGARSERSLTITSGRGDSSLGGGVRYASSQGNGTGTPNTRNVSLSASVGKRGDTLTHEHGVDVASTRVASNGTVTTHDLSRNVQVERTKGVGVNRSKSLRAETSRVDGETGSSRTLRFEGSKVSQPGSRTRTREGSLGTYDAKSQTLVTRSVTQESSAAGGRVSRGVTVSETTTVADGTSRQLAAGVTQRHEGGPSTFTLKAGRVREEGGAIARADGVIVKRTPDGDVSTKVVHAGPRRTRTLGGGEGRSLTSRVKAAVVGEKAPAEDTFRNGLPVSD